MKFIILLLAFIAASAADKDEIPEYVLSCAKEFKIDLSKMQDKKFVEEMKTDHNFQCFSKCMITKIGFVKENGDLDEALIKETLESKPLTDEEMKEIKECSEKHKEEDTCARFAAITDCIYKSKMENM